jgi:serine/threonine protein phosphatase 1
MLNTFRTMLRTPPRETLPRVPEGERVYAIGDIHGRLDLFEALIVDIETRETTLPRMLTSIILLGDLVDRGPESAMVVETARQWARRRVLHILCGNHEEMFLRSFTDKKVLRHFLRFGGAETLASYGVDKKLIKKAKASEIQEKMLELVPQEHLDFLAGFEDRVEIGDYLFVHAGIDPDRPLEAQKERDLRWIREPFLSHADPFGRIVVHGHTITDKVEERPNRIGIDTGAYCTGRLTALVLEGTGRDYIETLDKGGSISVTNTRG